MATDITASLVDFRIYGSDVRNIQVNGCKRGAKFSCHSRNCESCEQVAVELLDEEEETVECFGFRKAWFNTFLFVISVLSSAGLVLLFGYWKPSFSCKIRYQKCPIIVADVLLVKSSHGDCDIIPLERFDIKSHDQVKSRKTHLSSSQDDVNVSQCGSSSGSSVEIQVENEDDVGSHGDHSSSGESEVEEDEMDCLIRRPSLLEKNTEPQSTMERQNTDTMTMDTLLYGTSLLTFILKNVRYVWSPQFEANVYGEVIAISCGIVPLQTFDSLLSLRDVLNTAHKVTHSELYDEGKDAASANKRDNRLLLYGPNTMEVPVKSYAMLLIQEVFNPFYCFQIVSIILWCLEDYYYYSACIFIISVVSIVIEVREIRRQAVTLREMSTMTGKCNLVLPSKQNEQKHQMSTLSNGHCNSSASAQCSKELSKSFTVNHFELKEISIDELVPGDIIEIPSDDHKLKQMPADCVLVAGNVIMNESSLTGESVPVSKSALSVSAVQSDDKIDFATQSKHLLYCGTELVRTNHIEGEVVMAYVLRTGFQTVRGQMIRSMLHPKPLDSQFYKDAFKFVGVMGIVALAGITFSIYQLIKSGNSVIMSILDGLDIITILVPPALPSALTIGIHYAISRLRKRGIFCISPPRVNLAGQIDTFCFDKTGTLTEEGLDIYGFLPAKAQKSGEEEVVASFASLATEPKNSFEIEDNVSVGMATCHSLVMLDGEVRGDPIEVKMFDSIGWQIVQSEMFTGSNSALMSVAPPTSSRSRSFITDLEQFMNYEVAILHELPFSSHIQRMSVIVKRVGCPCPVDHNMELFCKGAPEVVTNLCCPESVPQDFNTQLRSFTNQGFRVLALASKDLGRSVKYHKVLKMERSLLESKMNFVGLLILQNKLKPETIDAIDVLSRNRIRSVMITGDNLETAVSVAEECKIVTANQKLLSVICTPLIEKTSPKSSQNGISVSVGSDLVNHSCKITLHEPTNNKMLSEDDFYEITSRSDVALAITGSNYALLKEYFDHEVVLDLAKLCYVYSRMKPDQKTQVVKSLQDLGHYVGMCGDGSNDCSALKAAHVGVALSQADASVASPFTSKVENISCVQVVIQEGRCALVTSFSLFKFMMLYSLVQFMSVQMLYLIDSNLGDSQQMYEDMVLITILALLMGRTGPAPHLVPEKPLTRLLSASVISSVFLCGIVQLAAQVVAFVYIRTFPWYSPPDESKRDNGDDTIMECYENTAVFLISNFQYVYSALVFSEGHPYRKPFYYNTYFTISVLVLMVCNLVLLFYPPHVITLFFQLMTVHNHYTFIVVLVHFSLINLVLLIFVENILISNNIVCRLLNCCFRNKKKVAKVDLKLCNEFVKQVYDTTTATIT